MESFARKRFIGHNSIIKCERLSPKDLQSNGQHQFGKRKRFAIELQKFNFYGSSVAKLAVQICVTVIHRLALFGHQSSRPELLVLCFEWFFSVLREDFSPKLW